ncbi:barstar family protein [Streptomyces sp. DW26H14]|uniref:barstar family protein n=1 Tax=Streptomyces sp. DW26H14 TaxID=3435395 RepID=UPI00403D6398
MSDAVSPVYVLSDEESGELLVTAEEVDGFFVAPDEEPSKVTLLRTRDVKRGWRRTEHAILEIVNNEGEKIGEYIVGRIVLDDASPVLPDSAGENLAFRFFGNRCEYPEAAGIWRRWASPVVLQKGEWAGRSTSYQSAWLHVVQNSWFASDHAAVHSKDADVLHLQGSHIVSRPGFFCAVGEAVNGPGGYLGSNLDAFANCISSGDRSRIPGKIVWHDYAASQESLDHDFLDSVSEIMHEFRVELSTC